MSTLPQNVSESVRRRNPHIYGGLQTHANPPTTHHDTLEGIKTPKRIRQSAKPLLNKLESEFFEVLKCRRAETIDRITCQSLRFKLANGLWYKPDFVVFGYDSMWCYEVKGQHAFRGGFENLKMAAHQYPFIIWQLVWKDQGIWQFQTVLP